MRLNFFPNFGMWSRRPNFLLYFIMRSWRRKFLPYFSMCSWRLIFCPNFIIWSWRLTFLPTFSKWSWRHKFLPIVVLRCLKWAFHWLHSPPELVMCHENADCMFEIFGRKHGSPWRGSVSFPLICVTTTELIYLFCSLKLKLPVQAVLWIARTHRVFTVVTY